MYFSITFFNTHTLIHDIINAENNVTNTYVLANPKNKYIKSFVPKNDHSTNKRLDYLQRVFEAKGIEIEMPIDVVAVSLKEALEDLSEITGENVSEDIINNIFSKFCLGK